MNIKVSLSVESIRNAIRKIEEFQAEVDDNLAKVVDILVSEGAEEAQRSYGSWSVEAVPQTDGLQGDITVIGDMPAIAEFGAGDATVEDGFANMPDNVYAGSYSKEHAQQYFKNGVWYFGGKPYREVPAHRGLYNAKQYIIENCDDVIKGVFDK